MRNLHVLFYFSDYRQKMAAYIFSSIYIADTPQTLDCECFLLRKSLICESCYCFPLDTL